MKYCFFTENHYKGGVDTFLINLIENWENRFDEILIVCNNNHPSLNLFKSIAREKTNVLTYSSIPSKDWFVGKKIIYNSNSKIKSFIFKTFRKFYLVLFIPFYLIKFLFLFKNAKIKNLMVVNGGYPGSYICRIASISFSTFSKRPSVHNFHNFSQPRKKIHIDDFILDLLLFSRKILFVSVSDVCLQSIRNRGMKVNDSNLLYIQNGITDPLLGNNPLKENDFPKKYILMLATYHWYKGHEYLLEAYEIFRRKKTNISLIICGDGSSADRLRIENKIEELNLQRFVELREFVKDKFTLIQESKIVVLPSQALESFGYVLIEAMACGIPVVATNVGGIPEVFQSGIQGIITDPFDPNTMAEAFLKLCSDDNLYKQMSVNSRSLYLERYQAKSMASKYNRILSRIGI
jgi:L-malate glycosyltransferase